MKNEDDRVLRWAQSVWQSTGKAPTLAEARAKGRDEYGLGRDAVDDQLRGWEEVSRRAPGRGRGSAKAVRHWSSCQVDLGWINDSGKNYGVFFLGNFKKLCIACRPRRQAKGGARDPPERPRSAR